MTPLNYYIKKIIELDKSKQEEMHVEEVIVLYDNLQNAISSIDEFQHKLDVMNALDKLKFIKNYDRLKGFVEKSRTTHVQIKNDDDILKIISWDADFTIKQKKNLKMVKKRDQLYFKLEGKVCFLFLILIIGSFNILAYAFMNDKIGFIMALFFGFIWFLFSSAIVLGMTGKTCFDKSINRFYKERKSFIKYEQHKNIYHTRLDNINGVQLCKNNLNNQGQSFEFYSIYIILNDATRMGLFSYEHENEAIKDAKTISDFLNVNFYDYKDYFKAENEDELEINNILS